MSRTTSFAAVNCTMAFPVRYLMTGGVLLGGAIALVEPAINTVAYHFYGRVWTHLGRAQLGPPERLAPQS